MKKIISLVLSVMVILCALPLSAITVGAASSGTCGDNLTWVFNEATGELKISGVGNMDFRWYEVPWEAHQSEILSVVIEDGVTNVCDDAFSDCWNLEHLTLADSIIAIGYYAFRGCPIEEVVLPASLETIGYAAFADCSIKEIIIPAGVTDIGVSPFMGNYSLESIIVEKGNSSYYSRYYSYNNTLIDASEKTVIMGCINSVLPDNGSIKTIGNSAFSGVRIKELIIPSGVTAIEVSAFANSTINKISLPNTLKTIGNYAFNFCSIKNIVIPSGVTTIGEYAFSENWDLEFAIVPASVTSIGMNAFSNYYNNDKFFMLVEENSYAHSYAVDNNIKYKFSKTACNHSEVETVNNIASTCSVKGYTGDLICTDCGEVLLCGSALDLLNHKFENNICSYCGMKGSGSGSGSSYISYDFNEQTGELTISGKGYMKDYIEYYDYETDTYIENRPPWYDYRERITLITIKDGITSIGAQAFSGCSNLKKVIIPQSVREIYYGAFYGCSSLKYVKLLSSVTEINTCFDTDPVIITTEYSEAYYYAQNISYDIILTTLDCNHAEFEIINSLPATCTTEGYLGEVYCPICDAVVSVNDNQVISPTGHKYKYTTVKEATCEEAGERVKSCYNCDFKQNEIINSYNHSFLDGTCELCNLTGTAVGDNIVFTFDEASGTLSVFGSGGIGENGDYYESSAYPWYSFKDRIKYISIGSGITDLGQYAFYEYTNLIEVTLSDTVNYLGFSTFSGCTNLESINIPDSVKDMGFCTFYMCEKLTSIRIPNGVTHIDYGVFSGTAISSITLPDTITGIGEYAFSGCSKLTQIKIPESVKTLGHGVFSGCTLLQTVVVPVTVTSMDYNLFGWKDEEDGKKIIVAENSYAHTQASQYYIPFELCQHSNGFMLKNAVNATCTKNGYSGDKHCIDCYELLSTGSTVYATGHLNSEIRNKADATCLTEGYSGDTYCVACDTLLKEGSTVKAKGHKFSYGVCMTCNAYNYSCGENLTWSFDEETNTLTVSGTGKMYYSYFDVKDQVYRQEQPWYTLKDKILHVIIEDGVEDVTYGAFENYDKLISVTMANSIMVIESFAFQGCTSLKTINFSDNIRKINERAFQGCISLPGVVLPERLTLIDEFAFYGCTALVSVYIPRSVSTINNGAFDECPNLGLIALSDNLTAGAGEFDHWAENLVFKVKEGTYAHQYFDEYRFFSYVLCEHTDTELLNAVSATCTTEGYSGDLHCNECISLLTAGAVIPATGHSYENHICKDCYVIGGTCGENINWLYDDATGELSVFGSGDMFDFAVPADAPWYSYRDKATTLIISEGIKSISDFAFYFFRNVESVIIPDSVKTIGDYAFADCYNLKSVVMLRRVGSIGKGAFADSANVVLTVKSNSYAHTYAVENSIAFVLNDTDCSHTSTTIKNQKDVTCTTDGYTGDTYCYSCKEYIIIGEDISATGHNYKTTTVNATCTEDGSITQVCRTCNDTIRTVIPAGHSYTENITEATCTEDGNIQKICTVCGNEENIPIKAKGHSYYECDWMPPTCMNEGYTRYECWICWDTYYEYIPKFENHEFSEWYSETESTCSVHGQLFRYCYHCYTEEREQLPLAEHNYTSSVSQATLTEPGRIIFTCIDCQHIEYGDILEYAVCDFNKDGNVDDADKAAFEENGIPEDADVSQFDFDTDGNYTAFDKVIVKLLISGLSFNEMVDANGDGESNLLDIVRMKRLTAQNGDDTDCDRNQDGKTDADDFVFSSRFLICLDKKYL